MIRLPCPIPYRCFLFIAFAFALPQPTDAGEYRPPVVDERAFDFEALALMEVEREKLATNLAGFAVNSLEKRAGERQWENARKFIGLALQLHARNRGALIANAQLSRGVQPKPVPTDYKPKVLAELLRARAASLVTAGGDPNIALAGYFLFAAVEMDPENEDAVYEFELYRIDHGEPDWTIVTDAVKK
jgi:hypothetical protein